VQRRYQVLLPDWLERYIKWGVKRYNLSFSELIRLEVCLAVISTISELYPEYKPGVSLKAIHETIKKYTAGKTEKEETSEIISTIYFEARKAIEYMFMQQKEST